MTPWCLVDIYRIWGKDSTSTNKKKRHRLNYSLQDAADSSVGKFPPGYTSPHPTVPQSGSKLWWKKSQWDVQLSKYLRFTASIPFDQSSILKFNYVPSMLYRVIQKEKSIYYEVIISVIVRKTVI
jgi:hypothetical protein